MCGIFGIHSPKRPIDAELLKKAVDSISYRGPDDEGRFISEDKTIGLGHKRLSIIDLSAAGRQPMTDEEKTLWVVFNGEIYNFHELKDILVRDGRRFASASDTEVLLYSYKKWGRDCLKHINGMFAFCIFDSKEKKFFLGRDRIGKKPLFYSAYGGNFVFGSELKAVLSTGMIPLNIDTDAVNYYFALGYIPGNMCIVSHVRKLPAGHFLEYDIKGMEVQIRQYWDMPEFKEPHPEELALAEIEGLLSDSVKRRLVSDVPLGAFLSGGVDSSLVVAFMRRVHNGQIRTFSVGFEGSDRSELKYAGIVAHHLGTTHKEIIVAPNIREDLEYLSAEMDEPIFDNSLLPTYYLSKYTKQYVTVALSGDGGDEVFGGYIHYASALLARRLSFPPLNKIAGVVASLMPEGQFGKNTLYGAYLGGKSCFTHPTRIFKGYEMEKLLSSGFLEKADVSAPSSYRAGLMDKNYDFLNQMCYVDMKTMLPDDILVKVDRASMFNSLEVRCPMLDYRLVEYSFRHIPAQLKIKDGIKKYLLKRLAKKYLPPELKIERKQGFDIPGDLLSESYLTERLLDFPPNELISRPFLERLVKDQCKGKAYLWHKLFALYFFLRWLETWRG